MIELAATDNLLSKALRPPIAALREDALARQSSGLRQAPTLPLIDAETWSQRPEDEDWLLWRGRRTAARLDQMPIALIPGERIVGCPALRPPTTDEAHQIEAARPTLDAIPPYPGGDSGHFHPNFDKLFEVGIGGLRDEAETRRRNADPTGAVFYTACGLTIDALSRYVLRVADECERLAALEGDAELLELGQLCRRISNAPPETFHEAVQLMFLTIVALWFGEDHGLTTPGRMDQTLRRFYETDLVTGRTDPDEALELICCLYIQFNNMIGPGVALSVLVGGRDRHGDDATCELTYLCLAARLATRLVYPTVGLSWHEETPAQLTDFACRLLRTGIGDPAFFNDELIAAGLRDHGVSTVDSYNYMNSTCVEIKLVGNCHIWVASPYFNCPQLLLDVMSEAAAQEGGEPPTLDDFEALVHERIATVVGEAAQRLDVVWQQRAQSGCFPLASCLTDDCLARGLDFDRGGARYSWVENSFVGLANLADGLIAIKRLVYETGELTLRQFNDVLRRDFAGSEPLRQRILNRFPSYGNADEAADTMAARWAQTLIDITGANKVGPHAYVPGFFCWIQHGRLGAITGATPDGRKAGTALADSAGAAQGRERCGPTASVLSTTGWSHQAALGGLVHNVKFSQALLDNDAGLQSLRDVIETYLRRGGFEIQVNVVSADTLRAAQANPEQYADLLVRVAGYSDYFVHLDATLQAEVIARTEHASLC